VKKEDVQIEKKSKKIKKNGQKRSHTGVAFFLNGSVDHFDEVSVV
jgi:hypothetical protein